MSGWDIPMLDLNDCSISAEKLKYHYCAEDDLAKMIGMRTVLNDEVEYAVEGTIRMDWDALAAEQNDGQISSYHNPKAEIKSSLLLVGDSFRSAMIPALRAKFEKVYVVHSGYCTSEIMQIVNPAYVIVEYVERSSAAMKRIDILLQ